jgi:glycosyltransferase involved in cell wall biosynthesis
MTSQTEPRVLLSAYQCGPGQGSVSQIGWEWYSRLSRRVPTTLVTHVRNREVLARAGVAPQTVIWIDTEWFAGPLYRLAKKLFPRSEHGVFLVASLDFYVYDRAARRSLAEKMVGNHWDIVHCVTPVSPLASTTLHRLGMPLVVGPLNGGLTNPPNFPEILKQEAAWLYPIRRLGRLVDWWNGASRRAAKILTATRATAAWFPAAVLPRTEPMLENGVDLNLFSPADYPPPPGTDEPLRLVFVGRLIPVKGVPMLLEAVARVAQEFPVEAVIVGDGPLRAEWTALAETLGVAGIVTFAGNLPLPQVAAEMRRAHLFCLPSVRESGGAVLLEAMACARPVVAVAFGGPAEVVDDGVGRAIPPDGHAAVTAALAETFRDVVRHPERWEARGKEGRLRAEQRYGWDAKIESAIELYRKLWNTP